MTPFDVDDAEASDAQSNTVALIGPPIVGTAVRHDVRHAIQDVLGHDGPRLASDLDHSANPAHAPLLTLFAHVVSGDGCSARTQPVDLAGRLAARRSC